MLGETEILLPDLAADRRQLQIEFVALGFTPGEVLRYHDETVGSSNRRQRRNAMKRYSPAASIVLALLAVLGLAGPVAAGDQVPFRGLFAGLATVTGDPPVVSVDVNATGYAAQLGHFWHAAQLGQFRLTIPHQVNLAPTPRISWGVYRFVAANGDTLSASFVGQVSPIPGGLAAVEIATIIGGTGRFDGATGDFTVERVVLVDPATGVRTTIGSFNGTISSPGAAGK